MINNKGVTITSLTIYVLVATIIVRYFDFLKYPFYG